MPRLGKISIENRELECGRNFWKIMIFTLLVTSISKTPFSSEMPADVWHVVESQKTFHVLIGKFSKICHKLWCANNNRNFAENVGITFHTPEEFFLHEEPREFSRSFNPAEHLPDFSAAEGWL